MLITNQLRKENKICKGGTLDNVQMWLTWILCMHKIYLHSNPIAFAEMIRSTIHKISFNYKETNVCFINRSHRVIFYKS